MVRACHRQDITKLSCRRRRPLLLFETTDVFDSTTCAKKRRREERVAANESFKKLSCCWSVCVCRCGFYEFENTITAWPPF